MAPGSIVIGGHSHVTALIARANNAALEQVYLGDNVFGLAGPFPRDEAYWRGLGELGRGHIVLVCYGGNEHNAHFLCAVEPPFDFMMADEPDAPLDTSCQVLPEALIDEWFALFGAGLREVMAWVMAGEPQHVFVLGTPAPKRDEAHLRQAIAREPSLMQKAEAMGMSAEAVRFTPAYLRRKLWKKLQQAYADTAQACGAGFIPVPPTSLDADGLLLAQLQAPDATHANLKYGAMARAHFVAAARAAR
ncbi:MAG TPA: hypothetical protein VG943_04955 [Caulobacterales bacterium]|nr:hypothetical protein [Caulobacterales bacterium]